MPTTFTKAFTAYKFSELTEEAKYHVYIECGYHEMHFETILEDWEWWLESIGLSCLGGKNLRYSVSHSQGDGVGFAGKFHMSDVTDPNFDPLMKLLWTRTEGTGHFEFADPALDAAIEVHEAPNGTWPGGFSVDAILELPESDDDGSYDEHIADAVKGYLDDVAEWLYRFASDEVLRATEWLTEHFEDCDSDALFTAKGTRLN